MNGQRERPIAGDVSGTINQLLNLTCVTDMMVAYYIVKRAIVVRIHSGPSDILCTTGYGVA